MGTAIIKDVKKLKREYLSGISAKMLSDKYKTSTNVITGTLKRNGVKLRTKSETAKLRIKTHGTGDMSRLHTPEARKKMRENHANFSGENNPNFQGKGKMSEDGIWLTYDNHGYLRRKCKNHQLAQKDGYIGEHVYQGSLKYGVEYLKGKDIHHINGRKDDNSWENLIAMSRSDHMREENNLKR